GQPVRRAAWAGWCFGLGWLVSGLWWLYISMHDFGGLAAPLAGLAVVLLAAALALYPALAMAGVAVLRTGRPLADGLLFGGCWLASELARAQCLTGFPWIASGYAHANGPLAALAPWLGVYGIGACAAVLAATLATALAAQWTQRRGGRPASPATVWPVLVALAPVVLALGLPADFTEPSGRLRISLLQPNVAQDLKFDPDRMVGNMQALQAQLQTARGQLVLTPESVLPVPQADLDPAYWASLVAPFVQGERSALIGTFLGNDAEGYVNSLVGVSAAAHGTTDFYRYGKRHLLPFGEYVPPGFRWFVDLMQIPLGDQAHGRSEALFTVAGQRIRPLICYEDLFGEDFARSMVGPQSATVMANASNLAWFGAWMIQDQHLQFSRMRSLEFQRPLVRATNTGATAAIDHHGQVTDRLPALTAGVLEVEVEGRSGDTPYARWLAAFGLWPAWALVLVLCVSGRLARRWAT
ncbi:apolipoprotein N-acyltransferase, partial [Ideonella sp.]|uniref:apolipoprotein N-acyltransferase n=1 Tax=Ideonella sp. TaxID=1929293 RepID=UPI003BB49FDB